MRGILIFLLLAVGYREGLVLGALLAGGLGASWSGLGTLATTAVSAWLGARVFRAHHVRQTRRVLDMVAAIRGDRQPA